MSARTVLDSLNEGLLTALRSDERVLLLGEDILDPYGGAFRVTRGCSSEFPQRVITTPISESALAGISAGMALRGLRPVLEIMFGDFTTLLADQLINHIGKFRWMYNNTVSLPLVVRTPMGGRRGYGPTHSQSLEKHYLGVPGLTVAAPLAFESAAGTLLTSLICGSDEPVLFIENKLQYLLPVHAVKEMNDFEVLESTQQTDGKVDFPVYTSRIAGAPAATLTLSAYGYMAELAMQAQQRLAYEYEIFTELVTPTLLAPFEIAPILTSAQHTGRLLTVEEGGLSLGWGAEICARAVETMPGLRVGRLAARDLPIPASSALEKRVLPQVEDIITQVRKMV